ncbi:MAG: cupin domain protein [Rhodospirillales bacterium]|jgi:oxalate decarboxylase/phosphoglucose isomerase-like protein (cupin superfamily)|nr:cupin domain protein [Rhodospirillales bacterium]
MTLQIRRVVTGHDTKGKAVVAIDEMAQNVVLGRTGAHYAVIWSTASLPADNTEPGDGGLREIGTAVPNGSVFRVVKFNPGVVPRMHRTASIDYAVVIDGEIDLELDDSQTVRLTAGDVLVQRATIHNWVNRGTAPCTMAFVLVAAAPVAVGGRTLHEVG